MAYTYKYPRPAVTADCIVITREAEPKAASKQEQRDACIDTAEREQARATPKVLLIQRGFDPYKGCWAFPGGFMNMDETTEQCAIRELEEETGLKVTNIHQIGTYSKVDRDPRGRTITVAYLAIVDEPIAVTGQDDAAKAEWFPLSALPELAFDHADIIQDAIRLYHQIENPLLHG
jgi:8-oxo-dGTP diphosphatase